MSKFRLTFKTPDVTAKLEEEQLDILKKWLKYGENITIEFDCDGTAVVVPSQKEFCDRCGTALVDGYCIDETCPFSDHKQDCDAGWEGHPDYYKVKDPQCDCFEP